MRLMFSPLQIETAKASMDRPTAIRNNSNNPIKVSPLHQYVYVREMFICQMLRMGALRQASRVKVKKDSCIEKTIHESCYLR